MWDSKVSTSFHRPRGWFGNRVRVELGGVCFGTKTITSYLLQKLGGSFTNVVVVFLESGNLGSRPLCSL